LLSGESPKPFSCPVNQGFPHLYFVTQSAPVAIFFFFYETCLTRFFPLPRCRHFITSFKLPTAPLAPPPVICYRTLPWQLIFVHFYLRLAPSPICDQWDEYQPRHGLDLPLPPVCFWIRLPALPDPLNTPFSRRVFTNRSNHPLLCCRDLYNV